MQQSKVFVSFFLDASRPNTDGKCLVKLNIYQKPYKKRYATKFHLTKEEWDKLNAPKLRDEDLKETLTTPELNAFIAKQKLHGNENLNYYYVEKYRRTAQPFAGFILSIIGVCIASRKVRGGSGIHGIVCACMLPVFQLFRKIFIINYLVLRAG